VEVIISVNECGSPLIPSSRSGLSEHTVRKATFRGTCPKLQYKQRILEIFLCKEPLRLYSISSYVSLYRLCNWSCVQVQQRNYQNWRVLSQNFLFSLLVCNVQNCCLVRRLQRKRRRDTLFTFFYAGQWLLRTIPVGISITHLIQVVFFFSLSLSICLQSNKRCGKGKGLLCFDRLNESFKLKRFKNVFISLSMSGIRDYWPVITRNYSIKRFLVLSENWDRIIFETKSSHLIFKAGRLTKCTESVTPHVRVM